MYFDFEDFKPGIEPVGSAISIREGVLVSIILHLLGVIALITVPGLLPAREAREAVAVPEVVPAPQAEESPRFVFVQPRVDERAARPPERAELSDENRVARAPERSPTPENELPRLRGNTTERVERSAPEVARGRGASPEAGRDADRQPPRQAEAPDRKEPPQEERRAELRLPEEPTNAPVPPPQRARPAPRIAGGSLGESLRNLERYIEQDQFNNPSGGGGQFGPFIQFDTKGVDFYRWIARFKRQVESNWNIPMAAAFARGHVMITFNVHKNGTISDLEVKKPASERSFNVAALGALSASNPTAALPPEYPLDKAFFTVTFFYNEEPPQP
jgi:TonB family protein